MRSIKQLLGELPTNLETGLNSDGVAQSLVRFGPNRLTPIPREPLWKKFLEKFDEPIIKILLAAALLSIVVDLFKNLRTLGWFALAAVAAALGAAFGVPRLRRWGPSVMFMLALFWVAAGILAGHPSYEGFAVMVAVVLATGVAFYSEYKSDREFEALNTRKDEILVKVTRNGAFATVPLDEVVTGDLVTLEMGDEVPADGRVVRATDLYLDQSLMTGESLPVKKLAQPQDDDTDGPENPGCLYRGTQVADGVGLMMVAEVGDGTMIGQIARHLSAEGELQDVAEEATADAEAERVKKKLTISKEQTPLQLKLTDLARLISTVGYAAAGLIFLAMIVFGVITGEFSKGIVEAIKYLLDSFVYMVIVIVVAVPEGLPMSVTVSLALAMRKMTRANSLVRQLVACETIGSATVICSDKTGTLTQNKMRVDRIWWDGQTFERANSNWPKPDSEASWPRQGSPLDWLALNAAVNSTANLEEKEPGKWVAIGNSTEGALLMWLREAGIVYPNLRLQFSTLHVLHFSSDRKRMTTAIAYDGRVALLSKGAPEVILSHTTHYLAADGSAKPWTPELREKLETALKSAAGNAMRTLGFAYRLMPPGTAADSNGLSEISDDLERDMVFIGFVAIRDPLREDVRGAVAECRDAGIEVKMITGDNIETARAIAGEIGLLDIHDAVLLTHDEFEAMSDEKLMEILPRLRVLARARPLDKLRMVNLLQRQEHVVAMTGDGTNDAPALRRADVGLAMGIAGTEVAKEASKIVLLDDAFSTIVKACHWGRSLYENIQRFIQFQLTINVSALTIAFLGPLFDIRPPFTVLMLLWINVIMDTFASIALCSEPPRKGLMRMPPKRKNESIVTRPMLTTIFSTAAFFVVVMMAILFGMEHYDWFAKGTVPPEDYQFFPLNMRQVTIFFTVYVLFQVWNQINCRSLTPERSGLAGLFRNPAFLAIASLTLIGQILIVTIGGPVFKVEPLGVVDWLVIAAGTSSVLLFAEVMRLIRKKSLAPPA